MLETLQLDNAFIKSIKLNNNLSKRKETKLNISISTSINSDKNNIVGKLDCEINSTDDKKEKDGELEFSISVIGEYIYNGSIEDGKDEFEKVVMLTLFPYVQNYVKIITSLTDMPTISIPAPKIIQ